MFIQTPNDLHLQSSTWSNYKHHNTAKFLLACTPNGAICFISPLFVGSISDVELTRECGFLDKLEGGKGVSIMADRGFTIKDLLDKKGASLNIPPFMEGRQQLPTSDVKLGRSIASLRIHVERAIGRIKQFGVLYGTFPLSMVRLANQIVCICAWLTNYPVLISQPSETVEDVDNYFLSLSDSDTECISDEDSFFPEISQGQPQYMNGRNNLRCKRQPPVQNKNHISLGNKFCVQKLLSNLTRWILILTFVNMTKSHQGLLPIAIWP